MVSLTSLLVPPLPRLSQRDLPKTSSGPLRLPQGTCNMLHSLFCILLISNVLLSFGERPRFEERELKPYAEPVLPGALQEGKVYFPSSFWMRMGWCQTWNLGYSSGARQKPRATNSTSKTSAPTSAGFALSRPMLRMKPRLRPEQDGTCLSMSARLMY